MSDLVKKFLDYVNSAIDEKGLFPQPCFSLGRDGKLTIDAMCLDPPMILQHVWNRVVVDEVRELVFSLDRTTKAGQGTEFADVLTCAWFRRDCDTELLAIWRPFVINYQHAPRIVRPPDFDNAFWNRQMRKTLLSCMPAALLLPLALPAAAAKKGGSSR